MPRLGNTTDLLLAESIVGSLLHQEHLLQLRRIIPTHILMKYFRTQASHESGAPLRLVRLEIGVVITLQ